MRRGLSSITLLGGISLLHALQGLRRRFNSSQQLSRLVWPQLGDNAVPEAEIQRAEVSPYPGDGQISLGPQFQRCLQFFILICRLYRKVDRPLQKVLERK
jgi:hypothetical protein